jgi:hypothetical protein
MYLLVPPTPAQLPALLYTPARPPGTLGKPTTLPAYSKVSITNPNQPRHNGNAPFFWVVGNTRCGLMKSFRQVRVLIHKCSV